MKSENTYALLECGSANDLAIDPEFAALCPPLTVEERSLLERSLNADGCRDPIEAWRDGKTPIVLDGHNRKAICDRLAIPYSACVRDFASRDAAREWVISNQLGRRNLTEDQKSYLRGQRQHAERKPEGNPHEVNVATVATLKTRQKLAKEYGVSERTIANDAAFAKAVDTLAENCGETVRRDVLAGTSPLSRKDVVAIARLPAEEQQEAVRDRPKNPPMPLPEVLFFVMAKAGSVPTTIRDRYGNAKAMLATPEWKKFRRVDVDDFVRKVRETAEIFGELAEALREYTIGKGRK